MLEKYTEKEKKVIILVIAFIIVIPIGYFQFKGVAKKITKIDFSSSPAEVIGDEIFFKEINESEEVIMFEDAVRSLKEELKKIEENEKE